MKNNMDKINYKQTAFVLIKPPSRVISYHLIKSTIEHQNLIDKAIEFGYCLYNAPITKINGKYVATQPWYLDESTLPILASHLEGNSTSITPIKKQESPISEKPDGLYCPFCQKLISSTAGRTLHVKSHHPDQTQEYHKWLQSLGKKSSKKRRSP